MDQLCTILAILFVVSLLGHGFWLLMQGVFRLLAGAPSPSTRRWCSSCQVQLKPHQVRCPSCGRILSDLRKQYAEDLRATRRQILRFRDDGVLDGEEAQRLLKMLQSANDPARVSEFVDDTDPSVTETAEKERFAEPKPEFTEPETVEVTQPASALPAPAGTTPIVAHLLSRQDSEQTAEQTGEAPLTAPSSSDKTDSRSGSVEGERQGSRSFGKILATFMEDRNIRWGEIVSSFLIVGCSIGLVISLWSTLESIPYFPALLFLLVTVAIHGAGLYTLRRWRLKTTSRGLLTIAQLLIPLNFLAAIALSNRGPMRPLTDPLVLGAIALGFAAFGAVSVSGSRVLSRPFQWWPLALAVLLPSLGQIIVNRTVSADSSPEMILSLGIVPVLGFVAACVGQLAEARLWSRLTRRRTIQLLRVAGIGTFASLIPLGLLCWKTGDIRGTLSWLSPLVSVAAASTLAIGLRIHRDAGADHLSQFRTAGTALSIFSGLLMASCLAIAWPHPGMLIAIGLTNFVVLVALARVSGFMGVLIPAIESLALAVLIGAHLALGTLTATGEGIEFQAANGSFFTPSLITVLLLGRSGLLLQAGTLLALAAAFQLRRKGHQEAARSTFIGAAGLLVGSLIACGNAALNFGTQTTLDVDIATLGILVDAVAVLAVAVVIRQSAITLIGTGLLLAALLHGFLVNTAVEEVLADLSLTPRHPLVFSLLTHGLLTAFFALGARRWLSDDLGVPSASSLPDGEAAAGGHDEKATAGSSPRPPEPIAELPAPASTLEAHTPQSVRDSLLVPAISCSLLTATVNLPWILFEPSGGTLIHAAYAFAVVAAWLISCLALPSRALLTGIQLTGIGAISVLMIGLCHHRSWWAGKSTDPRAMLAVAFGLTLWSALWTGLRFRFRETKLNELFSTDTPGTLDRLLAATAALITGGIFWTACGQSFFEPLTALRGPYSAPLFIIAAMGMIAAAILTSQSVRAGQISRTPGRVEWSAISIASLIVLPLFFAWAGSNANPWREIGSYATSVEFWLALAATIAATVLHLRERPSESSLVAAVLTAATIPAAFAAALTSLSPSVILGAGLAALCGLTTVVAWHVTRHPSGAVARRVRWLIPASLDTHVESPVVAFMAVPAAALSLMTAGQFVLSTGRLNQSHSSTLSVATLTAILLPLVLLVAVSIFTAWRKRRSEYLLSGSLLASTAALTLYVVLAFDLRLVSSEIVLIVQAVQAVGLAAVLFGLGWQLADWRWPIEVEPSKLAGEPASAAPAHSDNVVEPARSEEPGTGPQLELTAEAPPSSRIASHAAWLTPLEWQHRIVRVLALAPAVWATILIFGQPEFEFASVVGQSQVAGIATVLLAAVLVLKSRPRPTGEAVVSTFTLSALSVFAFAAISQYPEIEAGSPWRVFHFLSAGWLTTAAVAACAVWFLPRWFSADTPASLTEASRNALEAPELPNRRADEGQLLPPLDSLFGPLVNVCFTVGSCVLIFALRGLFQDPMAPIWTSFLCLGTAATFATPALRARKQSWAFRSAIVSVVGMSILWVRQGLSSDLSQMTVELIAAAGSAAAVTAGFWLAVSIFWQRRTDSVFDPHANGPSVPKSLTLAALAAAFGAALISEFSPSTTIHVTTLNAGFFSPILTGMAGHMGHVMFGCLAILLIATLWERTASYVIPCLFALPSLATLIYLDAVPFGDQPVVVSVAAALHIVLATALLASRAAWFPSLQKLGACNNDPKATQTRGWLPVVAMTFAAGTTLLAVRSSLLDGDLVTRLTPPVSLAVLGVSLGWLADACRSATNLTGWFAQMRVVSLTWVSFSIVLIVWGCFDPGLAGAVWLQRSIRLLEVTSVATFLFALPGVRLTQNVDRWRSSIRTASAIHGALALTSLAGVLILEGVFFEPVAGSPVTGMQIAIVAGVLVGLAVGLISMAVNPERDPLNLSDSQRQLYVYAAEALGGLLFLHIYLTMPELFKGRIRPFWPLIVMAIAFAGAGVGEILRRSGRTVLSEPLQRTGTLLPLLPALGYWIVTPRSELAATYSTELFAAGLVYVFVSMWRKSYVHIVLAAVLGNAGLWAMWHELDLELLTRPQLWLIPPALSALFASHINRDRLTPQQVSSIRYASVIVIYVSSTIEMFIAGIGENLWLPIILMTLSLFGIFAGIVLRVRAFLYLGVSFLLVSVISMVAHAARSLNEVWPWWVFGIATGIGMLTLFGYFEKRRNDMLKLVGELRTWER